MRFGWRPILQPGGDVDVLDRQLSRGDVDLDDVAVLQGRQRPADRGFRRNDLLAAGLLDRRARRAAGAPGDGQRVAVDVAAIDQTLRQDGDPSGSVQLDRSKTSTGLEVARQRSTAADAIDIVDREVDAD